MAQTPMDVYERMIHLSDNGDSSGNYDISDNYEYKYRLLSILNLILNELYPYSDTCTHTEGERAVLSPLTDLEEEIDLDDYCIEVMVYGAAARMFIIEDSVLANFCEQEYERRLMMLRTGAGMATSADQITDVYSGSYYDDDGNLVYNTGYYPWNEFGRW